MSTIVIDGKEFELGLLQYALGLARERFFHPSEKYGQWICPMPRPVVFRDAFSKFAEEGYLLGKDTPGIGEVYQITPEGLKIYKKMFPKERWHERLTRTVESWLWYKPRFYLRYGIWP